jgi:hypothetical protein
MGILLDRARSLAADNTLSARDLGKVLSKALDDGEIHISEKKDLEKIRDEMDTTLTPAARMALREFLSLGTHFDGNLANALFGISEEDADKLEKAGIKSVSDLLRTTRTHTDRVGVAGSAGVDVVVVTALAEQADLARTVGVGRTYAALLQGVGINNVAELSEQNAVNLRRSIGNFLKTSDGQAIGKRRPSLASVKNWIANAKLLPKLIRELGDEGPAFTKEAFDALPAHQKAMLFWGLNVRLDDGSLFPANDLTAKTPQRKPAAITAKIEEWVDGKFGGDFDFVQLSNIERIKLDDDTLGYRATFDVRSTENYDSEGYGYDEGIEGYVEVAFDTEGVVLDRQDDYWPTGYES